MLNNKKKVLLFINSTPGGAEKMSINIYKYLYEEGFTVKLIIVGKNIENLSKFFTQKMIKESIILSSSKFSIFFNFYKVLKKEKPNIVFSSLSTINWKLGLLCNLFPSVNLILRANNYLYTLNIKQKILLFLSYKRADKLIVQTEEMNNEYDSVLKLKNNKVVTLHNPVDKEGILTKISNSVSPFESGCVNYLYVGRIHPVKGIDTLVKAFQIVKSKVSNARLYIVGDTNNTYYESIKILVAELDLSEHIFFEGFQGNPYVYMKHADCFVLPSRNEGLPNVLIESLFIGTPVAATTSIPIIKRIVRTGVDGYLCSVDDVEELAEAMIKASKLVINDFVYKSARKEDFIELFK